MISVNDGFCVFVYVHGIPMETQWMSMWYAYETINDTIVVIHMLLLVWVFLFFILFHGCDIRDKLHATSTT